MTPTPDAGGPCGMMLMVILIAVIGVLLSRIAYGEDD